MLRNLHVITMRAGLVHLLGSGSMNIMMSDIESAGDPTTAPGGTPDTRLTADTSSSSGPRVHGSPSMRMSPCSATGSTGLVAQDALTLLAMYLSAIIHDYDHRGVTNAFLIQDEDPLAVRRVGCEVWSV